MEVHDTIAGFRSALAEARAVGRPVGFVPTMGYLHEGHISLAHAASADGALVVASVFVNPLQFAAGEDLAAYPRDLQRDRQLLAEAGVAHLLAPSVDEMYPGGPVLTTVSVAEVSQGMEGSSRPTHFAGVATVVAKLLAIVGPCRAYFGEKDYQQLVVVRRMAADLSLPVEVIGCPTVREPDGLAMSSRNVYLDDGQRSAAPAIHRALQAGADAVRAGERSAAAIRQVVASTIAAEPLLDLDYAEVRSAADLSVPEVLEPGAELRLLAAARAGLPRLLDNVGVRVPDHRAGPGPGAT